MFHLPWAIPLNWTTFPHPISSVAVIGAGPAGLQATATLLSLTNVSVRLFERAPAPGGNWFYTDEKPAREAYPDRPLDAVDLPENLPATYFYGEGDDGISLDERWRAHWHPRPVWNDMHLNAPTLITELPGVKYPANTPWAASVHAVQRLVRAYASMHSLNANDEPSTPNVAPVTSYSTRVERLRKCNATATWVLTLRRMQHLPESGRLRVDFWEEHFDAVVVATGHFPEPHVPAIAGIEDWSKTQSGGHWSMTHVQSFRRAEDYAGKTVLIVGASVSATEIARYIGPVVRQLIVSARPNPFRDAYGLDIVLRWPDNAEIAPEIEEFEPLERYDAGIAAGRIRLLNGTVLQGVDEIILATGYRRNTFLPDLVNPATMDNLHWTGHYIHDPTLAYAHAVRPWTHGRYQSAGFAKVWAGSARLPSRARMWADYRAKKYEFGDVPDIFPQEAMLRQFIAWLNSESLELGGPFVEPLPIEAREVYAYWATSTWKKDWFDHDNYTRFDRLPASEWPKPGPPFQ
ncbi:FAD/NAD-P-binding domain-containing protein [Mycena pura]|uniref:FAD/NAD-P-binding domain-containing protein n=1 Tax=Mycena pura TaxID=153505 RepID=A0AAD6UPQ6_9AGAR|nr:FAD/NAD-P-binding domain-containing protein [Mycena pura]